METPPVNLTECINWNQYYTECTPGEHNPFSGAISFDNIGLAWVAIFLVRRFYDTAEKIYKNSKNFHYATG